MLMLYRSITVDKYGTNGRRSDEYPPEHDDTIQIIWNTIA
jgi:hypothetical protein